MTDLLSRAELVRYFRTEEYADEIADIISNFPPAEGVDGVAQAASLPLAPEEIARCIDPRAWNDIHVMRRDIRQREALEKANAILARAAQPPAAPVEKRTPLDLAPAELNQLATEAFGEAAARARSSAGTDAAVEELAEFLCDEYEGEIGSFCSFNIETKDRWRDLVRAMLARIPAQPQTPKEPELLERASNAIGALLQWTSNWTVPFEGEDEWLGDKDVALRVRDEIGSVLSRPHHQEGGK
jgi:hypothetical protein